MTDEELRDWWNSRSVFVGNIPEEHDKAWREVINEIMDTPGSKRWPSIYEIPVHRREEFKTAYILLFG